MANKIDWNKVHELRQHKLKAENELKRLYNEVKISELTEEGLKFYDESIKKRQIIINNVDRELKYILLD